MTTLNLEAVSEQLKLSKSVIKRLVSQQTFPDPKLWDETVIDKWAKSKHGCAVIKANKY